VSSPEHHRFAFPALLIGSTALAFGPWLVRLADVGPVAAGFWRLGLALPFLFVIAGLTGQAVHWPGRRLAAIAAVAGFFFAADLAAWHAGIHLTKLGNATLFGNTSSLIFAAWGLWLARQRPSPVQAGALGLAALGASLLMGSSAELSLGHVRGDLLALFAGILYTGYLIAVQRARRSLQALPMLFIASQVTVSEQPGEGDTVELTVAKADGVKCARCWRIVPSVAGRGDREGLCSRCVGALAEPVSP